MIGGFYIATYDSIAFYFLLMTFYSKYCDLRLITQQLSTFYSKKT